MSDKKEVQLVSQEEPEVNQSQRSSLMPVVDENPSVAMMQIIANASTNPDIDVEKMQAIMGMKNAHEDRESKKAFNIAMNECQKEIPYILAGSVNQQTRSSYAKLDHINKIIVPIYTKHGLSFSFDTDKASRDDWFKTIATISHKDGHDKTISVELPIDNAGMTGKVNKTTMHGIASTHKYGQRYLTCMAFNIATGDDTDAVEPPEPIELISEEQHNEIHSLITESSKTVEQCLKHWSTQAKFNMGSLSEMPVKIYDSCLKQIKNSIKAQEKS